jgi:hypothetical protein
MLCDLVKVFPMNAQPTSSGLNGNQSKQPLAFCLIGLPFDPDEGSSIL